MMGLKAGITSSLLGYWSFIASPGAQAQERDSIPPVTIGGFVDTYYSWNAAKPPSHTNRYRNFDLSSQQFVLSEAQVDVDRPAAPIGFHIALNTGAASDIIHTGSSSTMNFLMQGYVSLLLPVGAGLSVDAGKFVTHMGSETISAKDNYNYSRSYLFAWAIPYYHIGVRASYPLTEQLTVGANVSNGWNADVKANSKTFGATVSYRPGPAVTLTANWIGGPEQVDSSLSPFRQIAELSPTLQLSQRITLAADAMYGVEKQAGENLVWKGVALYGRYAVGENSAVSARGEIYDDVDGHTTGVRQTLTEYTLTYEHRVLKYLLLRMEYRHDRSDTNVFDGSNGEATESRQNTLSVSGIVTF
jgi:hypothetical protein